MSNVDQPLVDQMAQTITGALAGCDLRTTRAAVYGGNVAAGAVMPLIAAAVDAAVTSAVKRHVTQLVKEKAAARAEAWDEGYISRTGDTPLYKTRNEWGNPYRKATP